ncbi:hypothetical protein [Mangrovibacter phragmitis]|nr:hypothetical protein [Mangrovibacter phragmitis]
MRAANAHKPELLSRQAFLQYRIPQAIAGWRAKNFITDNDDFLTR